MTTAKKFLSVGAFMFVFLFTPLHVAFQQDFEPRGTTGGLVPCGNTEFSGNRPITPNMCTVCHFVVLGWNIARWGAMIVGFVALVMIAIAGVLYIISSGNEQMMQWAKSALGYALLGVLIFVGAFLIVHTTIFFLSNRTDARLQVDGERYFGSFTCRAIPTGSETPSTPSPDPGCTPGDLGCTPDGAPQLPVEPPTPPVPDFPDF